MENIAPNQSGALLASLALRVEAHRADLMDRYRRSLQETLFTNRTEVRPRELGRIAAEEAEALIRAFHPHRPSGVEQGAKLCQMGLSEQAILGLGKAARQFILAIFEPDLISPALDVADSYQDEVIRGFIQSREKLILAEQERIRGALQIAIGRYTVEINEVKELAQNATEANEFKSQFIARISHELRTPLGALMGMAEMLQQNVYGPLSQAQQDIVQRIVNNAQALKQVFSELLDQSQIESGQLRLKEHPFSPHTLVKRVHSSYLAMALQKGLSMWMDVAPEVPQTLIGDEGRVEQVLSNLVVNAIKFTRTGGVTIHVFKGENTHWALQVKDTGIGISPEDRAYIFEPFRQADETTSRKYGGVGLGLSIVQQLVSAMGGSIDLESKTGQGSVFTVYLPIRSVDSL
ncbi:MAG: hypothetical protein HZB19_01485 [Chloroflexi bacterium]|nr:hypothetical protein [Chloroflexota bacterium]